MIEAKPVSRFQISPYRHREAENWNRHRQLLTVTHSGDAPSAPRFGPGSTQRTIQSTQCVTRARTNILVAWDGITGSTRKNDGIETLSQFQEPFLLAAFDFKLQTSVHAR